MGIRLQLFKKLGVYDDNKNLFYWRHIFFMLLSSGAVVIGLPMLAMGFVLFYRQGLPIYGAIEIVMYLTLLMLVFWGPMSLSKRYAILMYLFFYIGVYLVLVAGLKSGGLILVTFSFTATGFMLSRKQLLFFSAVEIMTFSVITILLETDHLSSFAINVFKDIWLPNLISVQAVGILLMLLIHIVTIGLETQAQEIHSRELKLKGAIDSISDAVILTDENGRVGRINPISEALFGKLESGRWTKPLEELIALYELERGNRIYNFREFADQSNHESRVKYITPSNVDYYLSYTCSKIPGQDNIPEAYVYVFRDITKLYRDEMNIRQSQKMEAIGTIAGGIAHDFNNMLGGIIGFAELVQIEIGENNYDSKVSKYNQGIIKTAEKAAQLTKQLLAFARKEDFKYERLSVKTMIEEAMNILSRTIDRKIEIEAHYLADDFYIEGDHSMLQSALLNLGINARDAMLDGGKLIFTVSQVCLTELFMKTHSFEIIPGEFVHICVKDNGSGISKQDIHRIFEPFFTTKEVGKGTGLGLSATYGTIVAHHGAIIVNSLLGAGTTFHIYLPKSELLDVESDLKEMDLNQNYAKSGMVLLIDDEEIIRTMVQSILETLGYQVITAADGQEGIEKLMKNLESISFVILDMIMPKMNGKETFEHIHRIRPELKVIMFSGFTDDEKISTLEEMGIFAFIKKPFKIVELMHILEQV